MTRIKPIVLKLEGGLGNQLFELAAGYYLAAKLDSDLHIDQYSIPLTTVHGETGSGYEPFEPLQLPKSRDVQLLPELPRRFVANLAKRSTLIKRIAIKKRILGSNPNKLELFLETNDVDSTNEFFNIENPVKLHGNFQSWEIVERAARYGFPRTFRLQKTPDWIIDLARKLDFENSLVLHFRVGDDTRTNYNFKQPDISYYLRALDILRSKRSFTNTYILSDDINRVKLMFGDKLDKSFRYLDMPDESSPAERLYVLSLFGGIVCANSTFCGWAAWSISNSGGEVVVPVPYADGPVLGSRDSPSNWIELDKYSGARVS
jgi:hypothetical protein